MKPAELSEVTLVESEIEASETKTELAEIKNNSQKVNRRFLIIQTKIMM